MYRKNKILALIPARSQSKRLPKKNIKILKNKPLFMWTVNESLKSKYLDHIVISTDDADIIKRTQKIRKIITIKRPKKLSKDQTKVEDVILNFINQKTFKFDIICILQPTSPLRKFFDIDNSIKRMIDKRAKALVSVCNSTITEKFLVSVKKNFLRKKISNKDKFTHKLNGAIYLAYIDFFKEKKTFITNETLAYIMPKSRSVDIDSIKDFNIASKILCKYKK